MPMRWQLFVVPLPSSISWVRTSPCTYRIDHGIWRGHRLDGGGRLRLVCPPPGAPARATAPVLLSLGVMLYIVAGAFLTALGKWRCPPPEASLRYPPQPVFLGLCAAARPRRSRDIPPKLCRRRCGVATGITGLIAIAPLHLDRWPPPYNSRYRPRSRNCPACECRRKSAARSCIPDPDAAFPLVMCSGSITAARFENPGPVAVGELCGRITRLSADRCHGAGRS